MQKCTGHISLFSQFSFLQQITKTKFLVQVFLIIGIGMISACNSAKKLLNEDELAYTKKRSSETYTYFIYPDKQAITTNRNDGIYTVQLQEVTSSDYLCRQDTVMCKARAIAEAEVVKKVMNWKSNYQYILVQYFSYSRHKEQVDAGNDISCFVSILVPINNIKATRVIENNGMPSSPKALFEQTYKASRNIVL